MASRWMEWKLREVAYIVWKYQGRNFFYQAFCLAESSSCGTCTTVGFKTSVGDEALS